jgi:hypothetical protein
MPLPVRLARGVSKAGLHSLVRLLWSIPTPFILFHYPSHLSHPISHPQSSVSPSHFRKKYPQLSQHLRLASLSFDIFVTLLRAHCCDIPFRPTPTNQPQSPELQTGLSRTRPSIDIPVPQLQSCQTFTTALPTTQPLCSRTLTLLTTTTVARAAGLVSLRPRMPTVNSNSKLKEVPRSFPRLLLTTHTSETLRLPRGLSLRMTRSSAPSTS